jgi:hypothetical protein
MVKKTSPKRKPKVRVHRIDCDMGEDCVPALSLEPTPLQKLEGHFALCRRYGVLEWDGAVPGTTGAVKFSLASALASDPSSVAPSSPQMTAAPVVDQPKRDPKVGADGLDADMQEELLGRVMDARR